MSGRDEEKGRGPAMDWMYKPTALVNRDDYLLGRSVDKSLAMLDQAEKGNAFSYADEVEKDLTPLSIFAPPRHAGPIDVIKKIKEDPLYQIQKKEEENLKQLLKNPVRMKQLREMADLQSASSAPSSSSSSKKKHKKKSGKKKRNDSSSDRDRKKSSKSVSSFEDIDKLLSAKLQSLKKSRKDDDESDESDSDDDSPAPSSHRHEKKRHHHHREHASSSQAHSDRDRDRERYWRPEPLESNRSRDHRQPQRRSRSRSPQQEPRRRREEDIRPSRTRPEPRKALKEDELEAKRREMMENAKWRDDQRIKSVTKYREEQQKEEEKFKKELDPDFIRKQLMEAASTGSVEKRIKANAYNIQKSKSSMNLNFARR